MLIPDQGALEGLPYRYDALERRGVVGDNVMGVG